MFEKLEKNKYGLKHDFPPETLLSCRFDFQKLGPNWSISRSHHLLPWAAQDFWWILHTGRNDLSAYARRGNLFAMFGLNLDMAGQVVHFSLLAGHHAIQEGVMKKLREWWQQHQVETVGRGEVSWTVNFHDIPASKGSGFLKN